MKESGYSYSI